MAGRYLLDTSTIIPLFRGETGITDRIVQARAIFIPVIALGELHYGARRSVRVEWNLERLDQFARDFDVLECDATTARHFGSIKGQLKSRGRPIPDNDIWIAALGRQHRLVIASRDRHFGSIEVLHVQTW